MPKRISSAQLKSKIRQAQSKSKRLVNDYNRKVKKHNREVKLAVSKYNQEVRKYNTRQRQNKQRVITELNKLKNEKSMTYRSFRTSTITLNNSFDDLESRENTLINNDNGAMFLDLSELENANSLELYNLLANDDENDLEIDENNEVLEILNNVSEDLLNRWKGALYSLNHLNPDAARHFCTSAREVYIQLLEYRAPDQVVLHEFCECEKTKSGAPTRKSKIQYILHKSGLDIEEAITFVDENVKNILKLFSIFNEGTHGRSGKFSISQLSAIRKRVEDGIIYIQQISS